VTFLKNSLDELHKLSGMLQKLRDYSIIDLLSIVGVIAQWDD